MAEKTGGESGKPADTGTPPVRVAQLGAERGYGEFSSTVTLANVGGAGMFFILAFVLLVIGIVGAAISRTLVGLLVGGGLVALAALIVFVVVRGANAAAAAAVRAHLFARGMVLAQGEQLTPYAWTDLDAVTVIETQSIGQSQTSQSFAFFELNTKDGKRVLRVGEAYINQVKPLAEAGGAQVRSSGGSTIGGS